MKKLATLVAVPTLLAAGFLGSTVVDDSSNQSFTSENIEFCGQIDPNSQLCFNGELRRATTPTPDTVTPSSTPEPSSPSPTPTASPTPTVTPSPTPTQIPPTPTQPPTTQTKPFPPKSNDGTYYITQPGTYDGGGQTFSCTNIGIAAHCLHLWNSSGVVIQNFTLVSSGFGIQADNNTAITNGVIRSSSAGIDVFDKDNILIDHMTITKMGASATVSITAASGCESQSPRPNNGVTVTNSHLTGGGPSQENLYIKCAQNITIKNNLFDGNSNWMVSLPDGVGDVITGNTFDLRQETPDQWLAIELAKTLTSVITNNTVIGPAPGDRFVYANSATDFVTITDNCVPSDVQVLEQAQTPPIAHLTMSNNGAC